MQAAAACSCAEAGTAAEALSLIQLAQTTSSNWATDQHGHLLPLPNRAHLFLRFVVYNQAKQQVSTLHVIDLAGSQSLAEVYSDTQRHREKLAINRQLLSLNKVISELCRLKTGKGEATIAVPLQFGRKRMSVDTLGQQLSLQARHCAFLRQLQCCMFGALFLHI